ncbi:MAG: nucleoside kinase, partial [Negativicutes bacterium]|nr:nucleoside kinase [Negativicutes bacterium]
TGCLDVFALRYYSQDGFILRYPEKDNPRVLPPFVDQPKLSRVFREAERWGKILNCDFVSSLNNATGDCRRIGDIVRVAEGLHEKKIAQIADMVAEQSDQIRLITIAGPSSSGKTTFANRLGIQLMVNGLRPVRISLDDYFVDRERTPRDKNGDYDFEALEAIDIDLFNEHLTALLAGEEVDIPSFDFTTGSRRYKGNLLVLGENQPLIIEGIHGLNERLTESVPRHSKLKVYVSAITQLAIDNHNRIATTDTRLIRRIVRDNRYRGHTALATLKMWPSVRRGEERNIFPFQEEADVMFNSALIYELAVLGAHAVPLLEQITADDEQYFEARRLIKLLSFFLPISEELVPNNSILREFIGGSSFDTCLAE